MNETYIAKEKPLHCLIGLIAGAAVLFLGLDLHFFHLIDGATVGPNHPIWIIFSAVGVLLIFGALKALIAPKTLLVADAKGITLFSGGTAKVWNKKTKSFDTTRRKGDSMIIPWEAIVKIKEGKIITGNKTVGGIKVDIAGGTSRIGGKTRHYKAKALMVLFDREIKPNGFDIFGISKAWDGYEDEDLQFMSKVDRESLTEDELNSGFLFKSINLPGGLRRALTVLPEMHSRFKPKNSEDYKSYENFHSRHSTINQEIGMKLFSIKNIVMVLILAGCASFIIVNIVNPKKNNSSATVLDKPISKPDKTKTNSTRNNNPPNREIEQTIFPNQLGGSWSINNGKHQHNVSIRELENNRYRLSPNNLVYHGVYELKNNTLSMVAENPGYPNLVWIRKGTNTFEMIKGSYIGAIMKRK